ncbi:hypothetical protein DEJ30_12090 [Curtobacterium sp. MCPF17_003]|uniref:hypothetical protein n=1 Tax=Curtobacterium sp. MCPF17_003 TaxID=2175637 RepID=UPI000D9A6F48|nr:hypothetical protein [Curtobacterium sp. MCPF17_003]PYY63647.1 hypothetical protein DEJ30_12090 [Curtobacterium sp. MCPF17_003]
MPAARTHDVETSHLAARTAHNPTEVQQRILQLLPARTSFFDRSAGLTDEQLIDEYKRYAAEHGLTVPSDQSIRSRRAELVVAGKVVWTKEYGKTSSGGKSRTWKAVR